MKTTKNLYQQILEEVRKRGAGETGGEITLRGIVSSLISPSATNVSVQAIYDYLGKALSEKIVSGIYTEADLPNSKFIWVRNKNEESCGIKNGVLYSLAEDIKIEVPLPQFNTPKVLFVNLTPDGKVLVNNREYNDWLAIAKINIPSSNTLDIIDDYEKGSPSGYIVTARDLCFKNDFAIDDDTIAKLRNNMNKLLADNLVGNIMLSEGLKILNMRGTLEMDSEEIRILYPNKTIGTKFNKNGTYFYDEQGKERARFTKDDARIGNIKITGHTLESVNYDTEGFQIKDTGEIDLKESHGYRMMLKPGGIFIKGMMCTIDYPPTGDDYLRDVVLTRIEATPTIIPESYYNFGAKNGQFIKKPAYADNTPTFPNHVYITYTTNEGTFSNEEHTFSMQDSVVAIITTDSQLDASYVRNLIIGKITNPAGNTYFDLLKGKLNIESPDSDEDNKLAIGDPKAGHGLLFDKSLGKLSVRGSFETSGYKIWDSKDDFDGEKHQVDIETSPGHILLEKEMVEWLQTTKIDFDVGIKTNIDTDTESGTFRISKIAEMVNQENTEYTDYTYTSGSPRGQSFKPSINCISTKCALLICKEGSPPNLTIYLKADNNNWPGTTLASVTVAAGDISTTYTWISFNWADTNLIADTRYWIYIPEIGERYNRYRWRNYTGDVYARGDAWSPQDGVYGSDRCFKIYEQHYEVGNLISQNHHFGTNLHYWEPIEITKTLNGQTITIKTQTAPDNGGVPGSWEEEKSLDVYDKPTSTIYSDTWFKWRTYLSTDGWNTPIVEDITAKTRKKYYSNGYDRLVWSFGQKVSYSTYSFVVEEPANTNVKVRFRCADTEAGLESAHWQENPDYFDVLEGNMIADYIVDSVWIEAEVYLETNDTDYTPDFDKLIVNFMGGLDADTTDKKHLPNTIANLLTDHNANAHPVQVLKLSTGSYSEDIPEISDGAIFATNKYGHQIEVKGESNDIQLLACLTYAVTTSWLAKKYQMKNTHLIENRYAYAQWQYHSASKQTIWGIWDKDEKRLTCVLVEEDEGYCKLYPELKENQKLIKIKNPKKYEKLFAWDIMKLSKEKKTNEDELEEI